MFETGRQWSFRGIRGGLLGAAVLLIWDAAINGTYLVSMIVCPIWFLVSLVKNAIPRPGQDLVLLRVAIPVSTLVVVLLNNVVQLQVADANARRVVAACEAYHAANGKFPERLDELLPRHLRHVPPAKYCLAWSQFWYSDHGHPTLIWHAVPLHDRRLYDFRTRNWYRVRS